jgi:hypothetical protein
MSLLATLFPAPQPGRVRPGRVLLAAGAVGAGTAVALLRVPRALDTTWAEDAHTFLADAVAQPLWRNLVTPYSGYLHALPRLLAQLAALFPPGMAPAVLTVSAALTTALLAAVVYVASGSHLPTPAARLTVSAPMLLLPFAQAELPLALATLRWQLMYVVFWLLLWTPATRIGRVLLPVLLVLAVFSDNVVIIFLPLALLRWYVKRDRQSAALTGIVAVGALVSLAIPILGINEHPELRPRISPVWAVEAYAVRPLPELLFGAGRTGERPGLTVAAAAWAAIAVALLVAWRRQARRWPLALLAVGYSAIMYIFVVMTSGYALLRYSAPVALLMITALVALLAPWSAPAPGWQWLPFAVFAAALLAVVVVNFRVPNVRSDGPLWSGGLTHARSACAAGAADAAIPVSPTELGWDARLPCDYLRR